MSGEGGSGGDVKIEDIMRPADEHTATDRHPIYFMGLWHA